MPIIDNRTILQNEINDLDDTTPRGLIFRLNIVASVLARMDARLSRIRDASADVPEPERPNVIAALNTVKTNAQNVVVRADEIDHILHR
ncbi:MAG: hypothetical protein U0414_06065 [Polyangiaceae bacterium]